MGTVRNFFLVPRPGWGTQPLDPAGQVRFRVADDYTELLFRQDEGYYIVVYALPTGPRQVTFATCWGSAFDAVPDALENCDPRTWDVLAATYPALFSLIFNAADDLADDGMLVQYVDPDDEQPKWFITIALDGVDPNDTDRWLFTLGADVIDAVMACSMAVLAELQANPTLAQRVLGVDGTY